MPKTADIIAHALYDEGVRHAFGIPGGEVLELLEAFRNTGIKFVLTTHEMGAGIMAEASYQLTGRPGVLVATLGPGIANTAVAVAQLFKAVKAGESWAICFWLKCRARWRETERVEHVGMDGGPVEIRVTYEDLPAKTPSPALTASGGPGGSEAL